MREPGSLCFNREFTHLQLDWHTLQSLAHVHWRQSWVATLGRMANEEQAAKEDVLASYWLAEKGTSLYGWPIAF